MSDYLKGVKYFSEDNYEEAIKYFTKHLEKDSLDGKALAFRGQCYSSLEKYDLAINDLALAVNNGKHDVETYNDLGNALYKTGEFLDAVNCFYTARLIDKNYAQTYFNLGVALASLEKYRNSIQAFNQYLRMKQDHLGYYARGTTYFYMDELDSALNDLNKAIELDKTKEDYFIKRGAIYAESDKYQEALIDFDNAIKLDNSYGEAYHAKAITYALMKNNLKACEELFKARKLDPEEDYKLDIDYNTN